MDNFWILVAACVAIGLPSAWLALRWYWRRWVDGLMDEVLPDPYARSFGDVPYQRPEIRRQRTGRSDG